MLGERKKSCYLRGTIAVIKKNSQTYEQGEGVNQKEAQASIRERKRRAAVQGGRGVRVLK